MNSVGEVDPLGPFIGDSWAWVFGLCSYRAGWIPGSDSGPVLWLRPGTVLSREGAWGLLSHPNFRPPHSFVHSTRVYGACVPGVF